MNLSRRTVLRGVGGAALAGTAGCSDRRTSADADVLAGPDGRLAFEPEELLVEVDEPVTWYFSSAGHNVSCRPRDSELVRLPDGASPFSSYGPDESPRSLVPQGQDYEHRFGVPGTYRYVCVPHVSAGMVGRVIVDG